MRAGTVYNNKYEWEEFGERVWLVGDGGADTGGGEEVI